MRITRAYTITSEVKRILDTKVNKSDYVCRAVRKLHLLEDDFDLRDIPDRQIAAAIFARDTTPDYVKAVLYEWMQTESTS